jgi:hypothetical protein
MKLTIILAVAVAIAIAVVVFYRWNSLRSKSTEELRAFLRSGDWTFYRNALIELRRRGVDIAGENRQVLRMLMAESPFRRQAGWLIVKEIYPDLAAQQLSDYNFRDSDETCKEKISKILPAA